MQDNHFPSPFSAPYAPSDEDVAKIMLERRPGAAAGAKTGVLARKLVHAIRQRRGLLGGVEEFLHEFSLSSREGLAIMALAESLLRVPDDATLDRLIADKLSSGDFAHHQPQSTAILVQASALALGLSSRLIGVDEEPRGIVAAAARRLGAPAVRAAARRAMHVMSGHFVFAETIEDALDRAAESDAARFRYSFDMLGEAARTQQDADAFFDAYRHAIETVGASAGDAALPHRPGVSVKLSALHSRYEAISRERVLRDLAPRLLDLARLAKQRDLVFTVDAEEADRLELSLDVIDRVVADGSLAGWDGFGLAVQAYQKRAEAVIGHVADLARALGRRFTIRLVKGAYWDTEIKRAQERGLADYPVFTRKAMTDANYLVCATRLLAEPRVYAQFATHNAQTVAALVTCAGGRRDFEFQRLHGMGDTLYDALLDHQPYACRVYAPVGPSRDLLAYLVRRLIENGANSSFAARVADEQTPDERLIADPFDEIADPATSPRGRLPLPRDIVEPLRTNSGGVEFGGRAALDRLLAEIAPWRNAQVAAAPSQATRRPARAVSSPIDDAAIGRVADSDEATVDAAMAAAHKAFPAWSATPVDERAAVIERAADFIESRRGRLMALLQGEAGKTLDDALSEIREAADLCRYYGRQARSICGETRLPGPTGENNSLTRIGRGCFICISPWNFPLAIYVGQIAAALVTGNAAIAKPAEQTPLVAHEARRLFLDAGTPEAVFQFLPGDGAVGVALVRHPLAAGVVFTGSVATAHEIARALAAKEGPIVPFIAETGGLNAMIVDSTALLEQVADDVVASAFRSAGQRCSALRLLCLQEEVCDAALTTIIGAARELRIGDPREIATHVGPIIDLDAKARLDAYIARRARKGGVLYAGAAPKEGCFVAPHIVRLEKASDLTEEIFGPVLHVTSWGAHAFDAQLDEITSSGYGLTIGLHSRIEGRIRAFVSRAPAGNIYVNRNMIGAVVGVQPFGGFGLSGTGPKAGGMDYLRPFLREVTATINTAALGGDAGLMATAD